MSDASDGQMSIDKTEVEFDERTLRRIRERVLEAEKKKLHLDNPRGVINNIEDVVREEIN